METVSDLVEKLMIVNLKLWHLEDKACAKGASDREVAEAKRKISVANVQRHDIKQELDELFKRAVETGNAPKVYSQLKDYGDGAIVGKT